MRLFVLACVVASACGEAPPSSVGEAAAAEFVAVYNDWDEGRFLALFARSGPALTRFREHFAWLHDRLGDCGAPTLLWATGSNSTRWTHACERGALETWFELDADGKVLETASGAADEPPAEIREAATSVIASLPWAADAARPFATNLNDERVRSLGRCVVVRPWIHGPRVGLFLVACDAGRAVFGVRLGADGGINRAHVLAGAMYWAPFVEAPVGEGDAPVVMALARARGPG